MPMRPTSYACFTCLTKPLSMNLIGILWRGDNCARTGGMQGKSLMKVLAGIIGQVTAASAV
jgi:hypothetical protein